MRDLARKRLQLVRTRTAQVLAVENLFARNTGSRPSANSVKRFTCEDIDLLGFDVDVALALKANVAVIEALNAEIERLEARLLERVALRPEYRVVEERAGHRRHSGHDHLA